MRSLLLLGALSSLGAMGCAFSPPPGDDARDGRDAEVTSASAAAVVVVERSSGPGDAVRGDSVIARFVRVRQGVVDEQALRIVGIAGIGGDLPAPGTCSSNASGSQPSSVTSGTISGTSAPGLQPRSIDLLDVGVLTVDDAQGTVLLPRSMPDPTGVVSGVFYSAHSARTTDALTDGRLQFHTSGGADLPEGFLVNLPSPHGVTDVRVSSLTSGTSGTSGSSPASFAGAGSIDVTWDAGDADDARDVVYVDVLAPSAHLVARCTALDVGHVVIPSSLLGAFAALGALSPSEDGGQISVHRLHRETFRAKGIEPGEVRFDVARVVTFHR